MKKNGTVVGTVAAVCAAATLLIGNMPLAHALPPGGANTSNTAGTSSALSHTEIAPCEVLQWEIWGFPPNEVANVKFDDGALSAGDASVQGQGVVSTARVDGSGYASNSVQVPCDFPEGNHWLRVLASQPKYDASGNEIGTIGFSLRTDDFVVTRTSGGDSSAGTDSASNSDNSGSQSQSNTNAGANARAQSNNSGVIGGGAAAVNNSAGEQHVTRKTVTRQANAPAQESNSQGQEPSTGNKRNNAAGASSSVQLKTSKDVIKAGGSGAVGGEDTSQTGNVYVDESDAQVSAQGVGSNGAPIVGLAVGGAILIVGLAGVAAYLYVNRQREY